jgi:putative membrane protein
MHHRKLLAALGLALCACHSDHSTSYDQSSATRSSASLSEASNRSFSTHDREFIETAMQGGMFEVESSRLALEKNASAANRSFANMMIDDHTKANQGLEKLVHEKGGTVPITLSPDMQDKIDELRQTSGAAFDHAYHDMQVKAHDDAIALFEREARDADDGDLKSFAQRTLPTLRMHRSHLDQDGSALPRRGQSFRSHERSARASARRGSDHPVRFVSGFEFQKRSGNR